MKGTTFIFLLFSFLIYTSINGCTSEPPETDLVYLKTTYPYFQQTTSFYCAEACMQMYIAFEYNKYKTNLNIPSQYVLYSDTSSVWTSLPNEINSYLSLAGFNSYSTMYTYSIYDSSQQLTADMQFIDYDEPAIVFFGLNSQIGNPHAVFLKGYEILKDSTAPADIKNIYYDDPAFGQDQMSSVSDWNKDTHVDWSDGSIKQTSIARNTQIYPLTSLDLLLGLSLSSPTNGENVAVSITTPGGMVDITFAGSYTFAWASTNGSTNFTLTLIFPNGATNNFNCSTISYTYTFTDEIIGTYKWYVRDNTTGEISQQRIFNGINFVNGSSIFN
jgi:hypothetical protein